MKAKLALAALVALSLSNVAVADGPKLSGTLHVKNIIDRDKTSGDGIQVDAAELNVKGKLGQGGLTAIYEAQVDLSGAANGSNTGNTSNPDRDVEVDTARIIVPGKWGAFVVGKTPSGQYADLYKGVKIFDNASIGSGIYNQVTKAHGVAAWKTPSRGGVYGVVATVNASRDVNEDADDARLARVVYKKNGLTAGLGRVDYSGSDRTRDAIGVNYDAARWQAGMTHEKNTAAAQGDYKVTGIAGTYKATANTAIKLGHFKTTGDVEDKANILNISHKRGAMKFYAEHEKHDDDNSGKDQTALGMIVNF